MLNQIKNKGMYILSIVLFSVSFGYYTISSLYPVLYSVGIRIKVLSDYCLTDAAIAPMLICFGLSIVLSVVLIAGFREHLRSRKDLFFTACAPLVLLAYYVVLMVVGGLTEGLLHDWRIHNMIMGSVSFVLLAAYMVGFYTVMRREQKRLWAEADAESL